jgi:tetratricopeptide (TPR) repeat protein
MAAYRESLGARLGRWGRRHRTAVVGVGAGLAAAVVFLAVLAGVLEHGRQRSIEEQKRTEEARQKTRAALDEVGSEAINTLLTKQKELTPAHKQFLRKMLAFYQEFAEEKRTNLETWAEVANAHYRMDNIRNKLGEYQEAESAYGRARELYAQLAADFPSVPAYRQNLASCYNNLSLLLKDTGRLREAEKAYQDALAIRKQLAVDFPTVSDYQNDLAGAMGNLANLLKDRQQYAQARELLEQAEPHLQAALKAKPKNPIYREFYYTNRSTLTITLAGLGDHAKALKTAEQLSRLGWDPASDAYDAACALSLCVPLIEQDSQLTKAQRQEQAQAYTDRAMILLHQAVAQGYRDAAHMKKDKDLDSLRPRADFQKLLEELEKAKAESK